MNNKEKLDYFNFILSKLDNSFGDVYFKFLAKFLAKDFGMKYCFIGQYDAENDTVKTIIFTKNQQIKKNFTYQLEGTPCNKVIKNNTCFYNNNVQQLFPNDKDLKTLGVESYFGVLLKSEKKEPLGLIAFMHDKPIDGENKKNEVLSIFLPRLISECLRKNYEGKLIFNENKYKNIFEKFQDIFIRATILPNGESIIEEVSPSIFKFSGYKVEELIGKPSSIFYHNKEERDEMIKILIKQKQVKDYPLTLIKKNGGLIYIQANAQLIFQKGVPSEIRIIARDVTKKVTAIKQAAQLEEALNTSSKILYVDLEGKILHVNNNILINTGYTKKELVGKHTRIFNSGFHPKSYFKKMWDTINSGEVYNGEMLNKKKDGSFFWVFSTIIPMKNINNEVEYFINVRHDITALKQAKIDNIRDVIDAQEKEKENFAKELHDGLGQMLLASKMNLNAIQPEIDQLDTETIEIYNNSLKLLNEAIQEARNVSHGLMSSTLKKFGLTYAINDIINNLKSTQGNIIFNFKQTIEKERYNSEIEKGLYRVIQELISNIFKHSGATTAEIELFVKKEHIHLVVRDNGVGLTNNIIEGTHVMGIGIKNMETRINYLSGTFKINEKYKKGTEILVEVPTNKLLNV